MMGAPIETPAQPEMTPAFSPGAWSAFNALVQRLPEVHQDRAGDLVMSAENPEHAVTLLYERYGQMLGVAQRLEIERLIEELPAERQPPWRTCVADWAAQGINPETVIGALTLESVAASPPVAPAHIAPVAPVAQVVPVDMSKLSPKDLADTGIKSRKPQGRRTTVAKVDTVRRGPGGDLESGGWAMLSKSVIGTRDRVGLLDVFPGSAFKAYAISCSVARGDGTFYVGHARLARMLGRKGKASGQRIAELLCRAGLWRKLASGHTGQETDYQLCAIEDIDRTRAVLAAGLRWKAD